MYKVSAAPNYRARNANFQAFITERLLRLTAEEIAAAAPFVCDAHVTMNTATILSIVGGAAILGVVAIIGFFRRGRPDDLGTVSTAWTTEHNISDRGGDRSRS